MDFFHSKLFKQIMAKAYGLGGAVVIIGALFKLMHWEGASAMLIIGLGTEAAIFVISAFEPLPAEELDWSLVYPELAGGEAVERKVTKVEDSSEAKGLLSEKLDEMLAASNLDAEKITKLTTSINKFSEATKVIGESSASIVGTEAYNTQITEAASHLEKINAMYAAQESGMSKVQVAQEEVIKHQEIMISSVTEKSNELTKQMDDLSKNIASLNNVYGGMLSAMGRN